MKFLSRLFSFFTPKKKTNMKPLNDATLNDLIREAQLLNERKRINQKYSSGKRFVKTGKN